MGRIGEDQIVVLADVEEPGATNERGRTTAHRFLHEVAGPDLSDLYGGERALLKGVDQVPRDNGAQVLVGQPAKDALLLLRQAKDVLDESIGILTEHGGHRLRQQRVVVGCGYGLVNAVLG
jgi:hypothetical protein